MAWITPTYEVDFYASTHPEDALSFLEYLSVCAYVCEYVGFDLKVNNLVRVHVICYLIY